MGVRKDSYICSPAATKTLLKNSFRFLHVTTVVHQPEHRDEALPHSKLRLRLLRDARREGNRQCQGSRSESEHAVIAQRFSGAGKKKHGHLQGKGFTNTMCVCSKHSILVLFWRNKGFLFGMQGGKAALCFAFLWHVLPGFETGC